MEKENDFDRVNSLLETVADKLESSLLDSNRNTMECYRQELMNVIHVLKQTKDSFHSKQIKNLREHNETVLQQEPH